MLNGVQQYQPPVIPRNDLALLGIHYRRIPLLSIGRDIYADTRLIVPKLEERFPNPLASPDPASRGIERLIERWISDAGPFARAAALIPPDMPVMKDPTFLKDRTALSGRSWSAAAQARGRPEAIAHVADVFDLLETTLLAKSEWIAGGKEPTLADVEAHFVIEWLIGMPGALPNDFETRFPKVFAWAKRLSTLVKQKTKKPVRITGEDARNHIFNAGANDPSRGVDSNDPTGLKEGDEVEVFPVDTGFTHRDTGKLVTLNGKEIAIEVQTKTAGETVVLHVPRWGFRVQRPSSSKM